jgi:hypothetical protein
VRDSPLSASVTHRRPSAFQVQEDSAKVLTDFLQRPVIDATTRSASSFIDGAARRLTSRSKVSSLGRHAQMTRQAFATPSPERIAHELQNVGEPHGVSCMRNADAGEPFREHLPLTLRMPTAPSADVDARRIHRMKPDSASIQHQTGDVGQGARPGGRRFPQVHDLPKLAAQPLVLERGRGNRCIAAVSPAATTPP